MFENRRVLVVVPARGGSKGLPRKNVLPLAGLPLVAHTGRLVASLDWVDLGLISTDDTEIADAAVASGLRFLGLRPASLAADRVPDLPVLDHALDVAERAEGVRFDIVVMLQPTSPLRTADHVAATVAHLVHGGFDAVWTVSPTDLKFHPLKQLRLDGDCLDYYLAEGSAVVARQQLAPVYHRNGVAYALTRECLRDQARLLGARTGAVIITDPLVNIDDADDFARAEAMMTSVRPKGAHGD